MDLGDIWEGAFKKIKIIFAKEERLVLEYFGHVVGGGYKRMGGLINPNPTRLTFQAPLTLRTVLCSQVFALEQDWNRGARHKSPGVRLRATSTDTSLRGLWSPAANFMSFCWAPGKSLTLAGLELQVRGSRQSSWLRATQAAGHDFPWHRLGMLTDPGRRFLSTCLFKALMFQNKVFLTTCIFENP